MSSTNRGNQRNVSDYYITPIKDIMIFLTEAIQLIPDLLDKKNLSILDPCSGGDIQHKMSYPEALVQKGVNSNVITTIDLRDDSRADIKGDYLKIPKNKKMFNLIITNPPFALALPIIKKALDEVESKGYVIMLLRLNFFGSQLRFPFWQKNMPKYTFVHHKRISFFGGTTDSIEYMHVIWQKDTKTSYTQLRII